jgi:hypothetical protein
MTSKLRIKLGNLEVDYEGTDEFIKDQFPSLLKTLKELGTLNVAPPPPSPEDAPQNVPVGDHPTNTIALKLGCSTGSDLVRAAAVRLGIIKKAATFSRKSLLAEMKTATSYYKDTYRSNLDSYLKTLVDNGTLLLQGESTYALSAAKISELAPKLG